MKTYGTICAGRDVLFEVVACDNPNHYGCTIVRSTEESEQRVHLPTNSLGVLRDILGAVPQL